jgi:NAD-dependent deacetylase
MKVLFFTGAGISAESGIKTFRDSDGTWEEYNVMDVAHIDKWKGKQNRNANREHMLDFYNERRSQMNEVFPNEAHKSIGEFCKDDNFDIHIVTQNVDNLHERGGATQIVHLHGELNKSRCSLTNDIYDCIGDLNIGDKSINGAQLRPHITFFGEDVTEMKKLYKIIEDIDVVVVCGTSLEVSPANQIFDILPSGTKKYFVNKEIPQKFLKEYLGIICYEENATTGIAKVIEDIKVLNFSI